MNIKDLIRCVVVSVVLSVIAPILTLQTFGPEEGDVAYDLAAVPGIDFENSTEQEIAAALEKIPSKTIESSSEAFLYPFTDPSILYVYFLTAAHMFPFVFLAAVFSSFWNLFRRNRERGEKGQAQSVLQEN